MSKQIDVDAKLVTRVVETRKTGKRIRGATLPPPDSTVKSTVDFSNCTLSQVYDLAERAVVISRQQKLRKSADPAEWSAKEWHLDAAAYLRAERSTDPNADVRRSLSRLSDTERIALLNELAERYRAVDLDAEAENDENE